jgi:uncharacterized membrane protein
MEALEPNASDPEALRNELVRSFSSFETSFRRRFPVLWLTTLLAPVVVTLLLLIGLGLSYGWDYPQKLIGHALATFFIFGRFIVLVGTEGAAAAADTAKEGFKVLLSPGELFAMLTYMDVMVALFVTFHMGILFRLPNIGPKIAMLVWDGKFIMDAQPWIKRMAFFGLVLFVIFPTSTTGSIGGSIFGRLLGLSRWLTVGGVLLGSILGNALMYAFSRQINRYIGQENYWIKIIGIALLILLVFVMELRYRKVKNKFLDRQASTDSATEPTLGDEPESQG